MVVILEPHGSVWGWMVDKQSQGNIHYIKQTHFTSNISCDHTSVQEHVEQVFNSAVKPCVRALLSKCRTSVQQLCRTGLQ